MYICKTFQIDAECAAHCTHKNPFKSISHSTAHFRLAALVLVSFAVAICSTHDTTSIVVFRSIDWFGLRYTERPTTIDEKLIISNGIQSLRRTLDELNYFFLSASLALRTPDRGYRISSANVSRRVDVSHNHLREGLFVLGRASSGNFCSRKFNLGCGSKLQIRNIGGTSTIRKCRRNRVPNHETASSHVCRNETQSTNNKKVPNHVSKSIFF